MSMGPWQKVIDKAKGGDYVPLLFQTLQTAGETYRLSIATEDTLTAVIQDQGWQDDFERFLESPAGLTTKVKKRQLGIFLLWKFSGNTKDLTRALDRVEHPPKAKSETVKPTDA